MGFVGRANAGSSASTTVWVTTETIPGEPSSAGFAQGEAQQAAELTLGHRAQTEQRQPGHVARARVLLDGEVADLRSVAVDDDHAPARVPRAQTDSRHAPGVRSLLGMGSCLTAARYGVAPEGDDDGLEHVLEASRKLTTLSMIGD